jgi:hypothetical protein
MAKLKPEELGGEENGEGHLTTATILVKGPAKGRWRIGRHFTQELTAIPEAELSAKEKEALATDPELMVTLVDPSY